ncbi:MULTISPECIES: DNA topoisomerase IV subunit B [Alistipes]|uniref:DNA topoisomerase (ATP-hydrolyzing) n=1 Tax=Alistipes dispar TaxID=2585119 RepID=A0A4Y1X2H8_9BACT|nr:MULTISPECIES: DNA topoisomerase IV subunit B [Alistipes]MBS5643115.1 type IIA DNA topoisomerase subunit B [Alistipes sp.]HJC20016.1 type IIA DNA topoisomerase subunit B [Candidatus Alistipes stercoripullorum]MBQ4902470.1 type IIA DNA topoisomerase subunit B [Alistipes sp. Marseille-P2263]MCI2257749.1 type IIA DNA topoisomerase subunit B [Alistipes dispar]BBL07350.1 DNA topoisomerase (ATP-hydrolyzing) [Alistipes dispar]
MADLLNTNPNDTYGDDAIVTLSPREHIRLRPGMYIGKLGDGSQADDGIYVLIKEVVDNSVDEFIMGAGHRVEITVEQNVVTVRDYGRGIPLKSLAAAVSEMNTGGKYGGSAFKKTVGLNGVGVKAVNMLSSEFTARSVRDGEARTVTFAKGLEQSDRWESGVAEKNGTLISFRVDEEVFGQYAYNLEYVEQMVKNYTYLNLGLTFCLNGRNYVSKNGLLDLLGENLTEEPLYAPIHLSGDDIEVAITHGTGYGESYFSFVNGQYTSQGGTHQAAFREAIAKTVKEFFHKDYDPSDIRTSVIAAISVKVTDPVFESQTKIKLGSKEIEPGVSMRNFVMDFLGKHLDDYLHKHPETAQTLQKKIVENEKERKAISGIQKKARETAKKVSLNNRKLRDCKIHFTDRSELAEQSMIFITEGDSASGSITASRDVRTQAVFSLRGKPLNCYGLTKKVVYENEEFNLLQAALNIEEDMENLRYNKVIIATDADVDGMHIRLLLTSFFLQFFPDVIRTGHLYILQTPLFRVRNRKKTFYCYSDEERQRAIAECGAGVEITRFKGLGEISSVEFKEFIGENMRLDRVRLTKDDPIHDLLEFYMGKNTFERQGFIIDNLRIEEDLVEQDLKIS